MPKVVQFSPRGRPGRPDEIELRVDEYEALKLADYQGYNQSEGAQIMGVSRPSFGRILRGARRIVSDALVNGKIIRIRTGDVQVGLRNKNLPKKNKIRKPSGNVEGVNVDRAEDRRVLSEIFQYPD